MTMPQGIDMPSMYTTCMTMNNREISTTHPRYVRWIARIYSKVDGGAKELVWTDLHRCSSEEMARFAPPENTETREEVNLLHAGGHFFCLDWEHYSHELFGTWRKDENYAHIDVMLVPCASTGASDCIWDRDEVESYMTNEWSTIVYHNQLFTDSGSC